MVVLIEPGNESGAVIRLEPDESKYQFTGSLPATAELYCRRSMNMVSPAGIQKPNVTGLAVSSSAMFSMIAAGSDTHDPIETIAYTVVSPVKKAFGIMSAMDNAESANHDTLPTFPLTTVSREVKSKVAMADVSPHKFSVTPMD